MLIFKFFGRLLSSFLARFPNLLFAIQHTWLKIGFSLLDLTMADWVIRRPEWLRSKSNSKYKLLESALPTNEAVDLQIAERIIAMSRSLNSRDADKLVPLDSIWGILRHSHYSELLGMVERGDVRELAYSQQNMFRSSAVNGYTYGTTFDKWPHRWHYLPVQIELSAVQLAESLGILRAECHEQGEIAYWRSLYSEQELIEKLESHFGFRIEQPRFGDPRGIMFGGRFLTRETCSHLHSAHRMKSAIERFGNNEPINIVEIGGGFGGTCYWLRKVLGDRMGHYVIVDLPEVSVVQASFLGSLYPESLILSGEVRISKPQTIELVPHFLLEEIRLKPNVFINQDSMPEMPESEVRRYLNWAADKVEGLFLSFNQETYSPHGDTLQVCVSEITSHFPQLKRLTRDTSWDRRGYVEEVYSLKNSDAQ
jgi:putative sugar O-methyltransferase